MKKMSEHIVIWEGLWNLCEDNGLHGQRCMPYNSLPILPQDLQLITCVSNINNEEKIKMVASGLFLGVVLLLLVPVSWVTHNVILGIANPLIISQWKPEMGASLYLG
ncbi:hypothetical protein A6R68_17918 [Neotoma lepida]|uniref:Claudin n=1 Tax=Neotoma lepida TaxID=56216 RepID=A0A1A6HAL8_NEOLE|nr:hypothetical protein A6R68_17918 [Neotoma lepida]